jgi:hypothetical protein
MSNCQGNFKTILKQYFAGKTSFLLEVPEFDPDSQQITSSFCTLGIAFLSKPH